MTTTKDCIKNAYHEDLNKEEIDNLGRKLKVAKKYSQLEGEELAKELDKIVQKDGEMHEKEVLAKKLRAVKTIEHQTSNLQRIVKRQSAGFSKSVFKALESKLYGSPDQAEDSRNNIDTRMAHSRARFNRDLQTFLHDNKLVTYYNSFANQIELANKMADATEGKFDDKSPSGKIAKFYHEKSVLLKNAFEQEGILTGDLKGRVIGNIHDEFKLNHMPIKERIKEGFDDTSRFNWTYNRWKDFILPLLDKQKTFIDAGIDPKNQAEVEKYLRRIFTTLINKDFSTTKKLKLSERFTARRSLHWGKHKDQVTYNDRYGSGSIQEAMSNEMGNGFSTLELVKHMGSEPLETLNGTFDDLENIKVFRERSGKGKEQHKLQVRLSGLMNGTAQRIPGKLGSVVNAIKTWEIINHLGLVALRSVGDLGSLGEEAKKMNMSQFETIKHAIQILTVGLSDDDKMQMADSFDVFHRTHNGSINQMIGSNNGVNSLSAKALKIALSVNGIGHWDYALQAALHSMMGRWFFQNKDIAYHELSDLDRTNLGRYGLNQTHYNVIRESGQIGAGAKKLVMPDSVQYMDKAHIRRIMKENGETQLSDRAVEKFQNEVEDKMNTYFNDRMDHVIQRGDVVDKMLLNFGFDPRNRWINAAFKLITQFKMFGLSYARKNLREVLYGNGARNLNEALWGGKANYVGIAQLATKMMAYSYVANSLANLAQGYKPPDLTNPSTYAQLALDSLGGALASTVQFDPAKPKESIANIFLGGPALEDFGTVMKLPESAIKSTFGQDKWTNTQKALFGIVHNVHPLVDGPITNWAYNYMTSNNFYEMAHGAGSLQKHYRTMSKYGNNKI